MSLLQAASMALQKRPFLTSPLSLNLPYSVQTM